MAIQIKDEAGIFSPGDIATLHATAGRWPFEVHVITSTSSTDKAAFEARVGAAVTGPDVVSIGIDPTHRFVIAHFGTETGITPSQWASITSAGNADFKGALWAQGLIKIADRATNAKQAALSVQPQTSSHMTLIGFSIAAAFLAVFAFVWWRNKKRTAEHEQRMAELDAEIAEKRARNIEEGAWHERFKTEVRDPAPKATGERGPRPLLGLSHEIAIGSAHQIAVATALARQTREKTHPVSVPTPPRHRDRDLVRAARERAEPDLHTGYVYGVVHEPEPPRPASPPSSYDSGGSSSSFGSSGGSSSGSSYDSGGSSSSFGSSGGSDFGGGGGFDSGGGSSSW